MVIRDIGLVTRADPGKRVQALASLAQSMVQYQDELEPWLLTEIGDKTTGWVKDLEAVLPMGDNPLALTHILPPFYDALRLPDAPTRKERLLDRAIEFLMKNRRHAQALEILRKLPERKSELEAKCLEETGAHREAAELYRSLGKLKEALSCYRALPDFDAAAALIRDLGDHPAAQSYEWLQKMRQVLEQRPENFNRVMQPSEKKLLEQMLEQGLGIKRRQPAARKKPAARKAPAAQKKPAKPSTTRRP
jgi:tetratricopeptide (TPR) repeat protein